MAEQVSPQVGFMGEASASLHKTPIGNGGGLLNYEDREGYERWLPNPDYWIKDPFDPTNKIETPVDERGLVDVERTVEAVKGFVHPSFNWLTVAEELSVHHLYHYDYWYNFPSAGPEAQQFRNLPIHKILVPRVFENLLHETTIPPNIPSHKVQRRRIESWGVARSLLNSVKAVVQYDELVLARQRTVSEGGVELPEEYAGEDKIGQEVLRDSARRHFKGVILHLGRLANTDPRFRLIQPVEALEQPEIRSAYAQQLGKIVPSRAIPGVSLLLAT